MLPPHRHKRTHRCIAGRSVQQRRREEPTGAAGGLGVVDVVDVAREKSPLAASPDRRPRRAPTEREVGEEEMRERARAAQTCAAMPCCRDYGANCAYIPRCDPALCALRPCCEQ
mmetsp:Transcript_30759/g.73246  ORF Transcript_30759/g.73246 Transcript_30759/m.73246 type:complete len:114 (-) Transcript_30759:835-1176(-)